MSEETLFEFEDERTARETATVLRELADGFEGGTTLSFGDETVVDAPSTMAVEIEVERDGPAGGPAEMEVELEFEWFVEGPEEGEAEEEAESEAEEEEAESEAEEEEAESEAEEEEAESEAEEEEAESEAEEAATEENASEEPVDAESDESGGAADGPAGGTAVASADDAVPLDEEVSTDLVEAGEVTSLARFQVYRDRAGQWRWRLVHRNGNIIATGGEGYASRRNARKGLRSVVANAPDAAVDDVEEPTD